MQILGAGLSKTGTTSLHRALGILGLRSLHYDTHRLNDVVMGLNPSPDFRRYDDVDAVLDIPAACFFTELLAAYPTAKCILTTRDEDRWWNSIRLHFNEKSPVTSPAQEPFKWALRNFVYGSAEATEFLFRKRFREHNDRVLQSVPPERLLVMNVPAGDDWQALCNFLEMPLPDLPFPHQNRYGQAGNEHWQLALSEIESVVENSEKFVLVDEETIDRAMFVPGRIVSFPQRDASFDGLPENDVIAIRQLQSTLRFNPSHIVFASPAFWWLDHYTELQHYLRTTYPCVLQNDRFVVFEIDRVDPGDGVNRADGDTASN